jgi:hypothetical protein
MKRGRISRAALALVAVLAVGAVAGTASGSSGKQVYGTGTGTVTCPTGVTVTGETIQFNGYKAYPGTSGGSFQGSFSINGLLLMGGYAVSGHIGDDNSYSMSGIVTYSPDCLGAAVPTTFTVGHDCGASVPIYFEAADGTRGTFIGNVACA